MLTGVRAGRRCVAPASRPALLTEIPEDAQRVKVPRAWCRRVMPGRTLSGVLGTSDIPVMRWGGLSTGWAVAGQGVRSPTRSVSPANGWRPAKLGGARCPRLSSGPSGASGMTAARSTRQGLLTSLPPHLRHIPAGTSPVGFRIKTLPAHIPNRASSPESSPESGRACSDGLVVTGASGRTGMPARGVNRCAGATATMTTACSSP